MAKSFTLIELLVVMAIIGLMTSIVIINYSGQKQKDLEEQAVLQFVSDLRRAQSMAMSVYDCSGIQNKYGLHNISGTTYNMTCYSQPFTLPAEIQETGEVYFLPIEADLGRTTIETENAPKIFTIGSTTITIEKNGQIQIQTSE